MEGFADAHLHLADPGIGKGYPDLSGASLLFACSAREGEWPALRSIRDSRAVKFYGVHPWFADGYSEPALRRVLASDPSAQVGEIGLDRVRGFDAPQMMAFESQMSLAEEFGRCANVHCVRCENEVLGTLRMFRPRSTILHSFVGPAACVSVLSDLGCYFSVSPRIIMMSEDGARGVVRTIPEDRLLVETDAPNNYGICTSMGDFLARLGPLLDMEPREVARLTARNARRAMG